MAGMTDWSPHFAHQFGQIGEALRQAAADYGAAVREEFFFAERHWFSPRRFLTAIEPAVS